MACFSFKEGSGTGANKLIAPAQYRFPPRKSNAFSFPFFFLYYKKIVFQNLFLKKKRKERKRKEL